MRGIFPESMATKHGFQENPLSIESMDDSPSYKPPSNIPLVIHYEPIMEWPTIDPEMDIDLTSNGYVMDNQLISNRYCMSYLYLMQHI